MSRALIAALVHGPEALGHLVQRKRQVEDLTRVDLAAPHKVDELGQEPAHRRGGAAQADVGAEQFL